MRRTGAQLGIYLSGSCLKLEASRCGSEDGESIDNRIFLAKKI